MEHYDKIIIGSGLYGLYSALFCGEKGQKVLVLECDPTPFRRATYINQARVHQGYHYPRSISTAMNQQDILRDSIKILIFASIISLTANYKFTDTTNAYRAYSARYLKDNRVQPLRDIFMTYELLAYLSVRATQIGMKACEIPVARVYPKTGKTPTKISFFKGNSELMKILLKNACGAYNPK